MTCYQHPDASATAFCRACGRALCPACQRLSDGTVLCPEHAPAPAYTAASEPFNPAAANPYAAPPLPPPPVQTSPGLAFLLGLIPGVGAIYNGQYVKGLMHAVTFGLLLSLNNSLEHTAGSVFFVMLMVAFYFYMPFEAYHTARRRQLGVPVDEWSGLSIPGRFTSRAPIGPIILIVLGILFLLDSLHFIPLSELGRFWPVLLIVIGVAMLYSRMTAASSAAKPVSSEPVESIHER